MLRDAAIALIKQKTGFRTDKDDLILIALQNSQEILSYGGVVTEANYSTEVPWFLRAEDQTLTLLAGSNTITLPANFIKEIDDEGPWYPDTNGTGRPPIYLEKASPGASRRTFTGSTAGPQTYQLRSTDLFIWPASEDDLTLYWTYYARDADTLTGNTENKWLKWVPSLLIGHAGQGIASDLRDTSAVEEFKRLKLEGQKQLLTQNVQRETANRRTAFGVLK